MYSSSIEKWKRFEPHLRHIAEQIGQSGNSAVRMAAN
jgi:hypothetical protein